MLKNLISKLLILLGMVFFQVLMVFFWYRHGIFWSSDRNYVTWIPRWS